jgi:hypothetical protein
MAIGSAPPIGETFYKIEVVNGFLDDAAMQRWFDYHKKRVEEDGLMYDEAKIGYPRREVVDALVAEAKAEIEQARVSARPYKT